MRFELANGLVQGVVLDLADAAERVGGLGQVAVGVVFVGGDGRCREAGADRLFLVQGDGAGAEGRAGKFFGLRPHFLVPIFSSIDAVHCVHRIYGPRRNKQ